MKKKPIYAVFDIGKTNKKLILFDEERQIISEHLHVCTDVADEDGYACDHLPRLTQWVQDQWQNLKQNPLYTVKGLTFTAYGATWVHLDESGQPFMPLYSYLRPFPDECAQRFFAALDQSPEEFAVATRTPYLGMRNAGLQLYWLKHARPEQYARIHTSLYLPQYLSYLITGDMYSDYTSVGCHTALWDFDRQDYHEWVYREGIDAKLPPIIQDSVSTVENGVLIGVGMHDSSAAVVAYLSENEDTPFVLVSTGNWGIAFNPFNQQPLTPALLRANCLHYLTSGGEPLLAACLLLGQEHDYQVERIARHFSTQPTFYRSLVSARPSEQLTDDFRPTWLDSVEPARDAAPLVEEWSLVPFKTAADAYQHLMYALVNRTKAAIDRVRQDEPTIFVDGGFARNPLFMQYLKRHYSSADIRTLEVPQATAIGALCHLEQGEARKKTRPLFS
jgi:L-fuculokinase